MMLPPALVLPPPRPMYHHTLYSGPPSSLGAHPSHTSWTGLPRRLHRRHSRVAFRTCTDRWALMSVIAGHLSTDITWSYSFSTHKEVGSRYVSFFDDITSIWLTYVQGILTERKVSLLFVVSAYSSCNWSLRISISATSLLNNTIPTIWKDLLCIPLSFSSRCRKYVYNGRPSWPLNVILTIEES